MKTYKNLSRTIFFLWFQRTLPVFYIQHVTLVDTSRLMHLSILLLGLTSSSMRYISIITVCYGETCFYVLFFLLFCFFVCVFSGLLFVVLSEFSKVLFPFMMRFRKTMQLSRLFRFSKLGKNSLWKVLV